MLEQDSILIITLTVLAIIGGAFGVYIRKHKNGTDPA